MWGVFLSLLGVIAASFFGANHARAVFDTQLLLGYRITTTTCSQDDADSEAKLSGWELQAGAQFDPVPMIPFAVGGTIFYTKVDGGENPRSAKGWGFDVEGKFWYPIPRSRLTPFVKGAYTVAGVYSVTTSEDTYQYAPSGIALSAGLRYDLLFRGGFFIQGTYRSNELKRGSIKDSETSTSVLIGSQFGL